MSRKPKPELMTPIFETAVQALEVFHKVERGEEVDQDQFSKALSELGTFVAISMRCLPHVSSERLARAASTVLVGAAANQASGKAQKGS